MLPSKGWKNYEEDLRTLGEHRGSVDREALEFLASLGLAKAEPAGLTDLGRRYFRSRFIEEDAGGAVEILRHQLLTSCPEAAAICQLLANRPQVSRSIAETVLRSQGYGLQLTNRRLGSLLALMDHGEVITYEKRAGGFRVVAQPLLEPALPDSMFVSRDTPWSNRQWLRRVLRECGEYIFWLDKHWLPEGLDFLGEAADGDRVSEIRIASLALPENETRKTKRAYRDLGRELATRGISLEWRFVESTEVRGTHDRWIISTRRAWNVPNLNAILSGQHSEIVATSNISELRGVFTEVWDCAPTRPYE